MGDFGQYHIRQGRLEDCLDIARMIDSSAEGATNYLYQHVRQGKSSIEVLAEQLASEVHYSYANTIVAEFNNNVVAMALSFPSNGLVLDENLLQQYSASRQQYLKYFSTNRINDSWHLDAIYVDAPHRNVGLGGHLLAAVKQQAGYYGFPVLQVFVFGSNEDAIRFYRANGFSIDKRIQTDSHEFLSHHGYLLLMKCTLEE